ncbi:uncharacterized protein [Littorina saxatilis]|uniref:Uncharacterized protein n=1 Tax=Littorina saxatilis TaxID=31220 RepID=A0AAN9BY24_9CAEN
MAKWTWLLCLVFVSVTQLRGEENSEKSLGVLGDLGLDSATAPSLQSGPPSKAQTGLNHETPKPFLLSLPGLLSHSQPSADTHTDTPAPSLLDGIVKQNITQRTGSAGSQGTVGVLGGLADSSNTGTQGVGKTDRQLGPERANYIVAEDPNIWAEPGVQDSNSLTESNSEVGNGAQSWKDSKDVAKELGSLFDNSQWNEGALGVHKTGNDAVNPTPDKWQAEQRQREKDEPVEEGEPDSVEITLPPSLVSEENVEKAGEKLQSLTLSNDTDSVDTEGGTGGDWSLGNPPMLSNSDLQNLGEIIPDDFSPEEQEKLRQTISDSLGLSALGPGLAMLPHSQNVPVQSTGKPTTPQLFDSFQGSNSPAPFKEKPSLSAFQSPSSLLEEKPVPSSLQSLSSLLGVKPIPSGLQSSSSQQYSAPTSAPNGKPIHSELVSLGDAMPGLNAINSREGGLFTNGPASSQLAGAEQNTESEKDGNDPGEEEEKEDFEPGESYGMKEEKKELEGGESYGRKMLNEQDEGGEDYNDYEETKPSEDVDEGYEDDYDYEEDDREDYVGGEVNLSPEWTTPGAPVTDGDANRDAAQDLNSLADDGVAGENAERVNGNATPGDWRGDSNDYKMDDDWYYNPDNKPVSQDLKSSSHPHSSSSTTHPVARNTATTRLTTGGVNADDHSKQESVSQIVAPDFKEGVMHTQDVHTKKALQAPKGTIILYTALIVVFIAGVVLFSLWKNPFKGHNNRPTHQLPVVRTGEEGKRLLDHPFV